MTKVHLNKSRGFTLFETVIYVALFGILLGGAVLSSFEIISSIGRSKKEALLEVEGNFLLSKVAWALSGSVWVTAPVYNSTTTMLGINVIYPISDTYLISAGSNSLLFSKTGVASESLVGNDVIVKNVTFFHSGTSTVEYVAVNFTLETHADSGEILSANFSQIDYLNN